MSAVGKKSSLKTLFLPPQVLGRPHGYLQLTVEKVHWTTTKKFSEVEIQIKWWGESEGTIFRFNSALPQVQPLRYQINTNNHLLQSYLAQCESISVGIFSIKNKDLVGRVSIRIPDKLHNLKDTVECLRAVHPILSARNFKIGEMTVSFGVSFDLDQVISIKSKPERENHERGKRVTFKLNEKANKENFSVVGTKMPLATRDRKPPTQSTLKSRNFPSINQNASRRPSIVSQSSSISDSTNSTLKSSKDDSIVSQKIDDSMIDAVKIEVNSLELNYNGLSQVRSFIDNLSDQKCIIKCAVTSKLIKAQSDDSNFISYVFDKASQKIDFRKKDLLFYLQSTPDDLSYLNFGFCLKSIGGEISPLLIGLTRINFREILKGSFYKKCQVFNEENFKIGHATISINTGDHLRSRDLHQCNHLPSAPTVIKKIHLVDQNVQTTSYPSTSNDCENPSERRDHENKNVQTNEIRMRNVEKASSDLEDSNNRDTEMIDVEMKENKATAKIYHVLLFIESLKNVKDESLSRDYFITYEGFWNQCQESTESSVNYIFNYLKQSPIMCDEGFLKRVQNSHLELKLWEKTSDNSEKLVGCTRVPLHQFYIAFKDIAMIEHLSTNKLPIISTDSWCNFISPLSSELFCNGKILLAIGSEHQIDYLIMSRDLHRLKPPTKIEQQPQESQQASDTNAQLKSRLSAFIESLSQKLPEPSAASESHQKVLHSSPSDCSSSPQIRKTSDLLDSLQKALAQPPSANDLNLFSQMNQAQNISTISQTNNDDIRMIVSIESAANLPKIIKKARNKRSKNKTSPQQKSEYEPMSYATFEASIGDEYQESIVKSHEGNVYCTKVVKGCHPTWNENFEVGVSFDILRNPQKKFVIKVWRKAKFDQQIELKPAPFEDAVIGFSAIDLSALLTGLPVLSGYYNIVDFSGRTNGQIKISFKPLEDVATFRSPSSPLVPLACPLNIDVNCMETSEGNSVLSRTLKRKFTELDEITQRLKARLFDVTGDENFDPDEEFERDLNTAVDDEEENFNDKENFGWLSEGNGAMDFQEQLNKILESQQPSTSKGTAAPSTSTLPTHREISGCSSSDEAPPLAIDHLLKKYDLDTLINPSIFKNIIDPNIANSDSTPTLLPHKVSSKSNDEENHDESGETTVSSIISNDHVQTIEKALQRTSLHESENVSIDRKEPEGEQHVSE